MAEFDIGNNLVAVISLLVSSVAIPLIGIAAHKRYKKGKEKV